MSSSSLLPSKRSRISSQSKKGFAQRDVDAFRLLGQNLSATSASDVNLEAARPEQKERRQVFRQAEETSGLFSGFENVGPARKIRDEGFKGRFSNLGGEDVDRLLQSFQRRKTSILSRRRQPGRQQLLANS